jgi:hypothetical protein
MSEYLRPAALAALFLGVGFLLGYPKGRDDILDYLISGSNIPSTPKIITFDHGICVSGHIWWNMREGKCLVEDRPGKNYGEIRAAAKKQAENQP